MDLRLEAIATPAKRSPHRLYIYKINNNTTNHTLMLCATEKKQSNIQVNKVIYLYIVRIGSATLSITISLDDAYFKTSDLKILIQLSIIKCK